MIILKQNSIYTGKCEHILPYFQEGSFDSLVTDAPYGFGDEPDPVEVMTDWIAQGFHHVANKGGFMGKEWDAFVPQPLTFKSAYRVLKPGAHALVCCGTRTLGWMDQSLRFAGFEIRDIIAWHYGTGFPKSMDISKAIDKAAGAEREVLQSKKTTSGGMASINKGNLDQGFRPNNYNEDGNTFEITAPATDEAKQWDGYGTALKPATELWILARKPIAEKTIAKNILKWGTGGLNINACRIPFAGTADFNGAKFGRGTEILGGNYVAGSNTKSSGRENIEANPVGRWPANVILDPFMAAEMDRQAPIAGAFAAGDSRKGISKGKYGDFATKGDDGASFYADTGGASRFFYCAKPSEYERHHGLQKFTGEFPKGNDHVTVKPVELMRWLVKLITPKNGLMLDCFCGSGSTLIGAKLENINYVGIDMDRRNCRISELRVNAWNPEKYKAQTLFD